MINIFRIYTVYMKCKTSNHIYAHIDCDSFFASCEILRNPKLQGKYVCVGSEIIVAATYNAKKLGVKVGTPIWEAKKILKHKDAHFSWVHMSMYIEISRKLMAYLRENTLDVRVFSVDEAFVEITGLPEMNHLDIEQYLKNLQEDILKQIGIPVSIGVSNTRLKAKIFSKARKPFGICVWIDSEEEKNIFQNLSFREIPFIWSKTAKKLENDITTITDYINIWYFEITQRFGKNGGRLWLELRGVSSMQFLPKTVAKSIGRARGFNREMTSESTRLLQWIKYNLDRLCDELYYKWCEIGDIQLLLIDSDWKRYKAHSELPVFTSDRREILRVLTKLFHQIYLPGILYRKTGVFSSQIQTIEHKQLSLFQQENTAFTTNQNIEKLLSEVEGKYGKGVLRVWA